MRLDWLTKPVTVEELRQDRNGSELWKRLLDAYREGDELWEFSSPPDYWKNLVGRGGIALVRQGTIIETVLTIMN